jgi:hypothetical protein
MPDKRPIRDALEPVTSALSSHGNTLHAVREALWGDGLKIISDRGFPFSFCSCVLLSDVLGSGPPCDGSEGLREGDGTETDRSGV